MRNKIPKAGFSLIELMMAMLATSILVLAVGSMLVYGWMGWKRNNDSVAMQRDVSLAMRIIAREIRRTPMTGITVGDTLTCINANGTYAFTASGRDLNFQVDSEVTFPLVRDCLSGFSTTNNPLNGSVAVLLNLNTAGMDVSTNSMVVFTRN